MPRKEGPAAFREAVFDDARLGFAHISLYVALCHFWSQRGGEPEIGIKRQEVMEWAKIRSSATYHKCLRALVECGYVDYTPSFNPAQKSTVRLR